MKRTKKHRQHGRCHSDGKGLKNFPLFADQHKEIFLIYWKLLKIENLWVIEEFLAVS